jgi:hypothetical protein
MGLDMYLNARAYVSNYDFSKAQERKTYTDMVKVLGLEKAASKDSSFATLEVCVIYWRKANSIHNWFVENVQDNQDDCGSYYVEREKLIELRDACISVIERKESPEDVLPPKEGFFFGPTEINDWYFEDLERTVNEINRVLSSIPDNVDLYYHSSW